LFEEAKYTCDSIEVVNWFYAWPGRIAQKNYVFVAKGLKNKNDLSQQNDNDNTQPDEKDKVHMLSRANNGRVKKWNKNKELSNNICIVFG
jgi:hypothetical protein